MPHAFAAIPRILVNAHAIGLLDREKNTRRQRYRRRRHPVCRSWIAPSGVTWGMPSAPTPRPVDAPTLSAVEFRVRQTQVPSPDDLSRILGRYAKWALIDAILTGPPRCQMAPSTEDRKGLGRRRKETVKGGGGLLGRA